MKNIYLLIGPSGSGKTTIAEGLEKWGYKSVVSYTTRPPRYLGETGHIFVSKETFDSLQPMVAYTRFNGYEYGVTEDIINTHDIYVIDIEGAKFFKEHYHGPKGVVCIGLDVPANVCAARMKKRGDDPEKIASRIKFDQEAFKDLKSYCDVMLNAKLPIDTLVFEICNQIVHYESLVEF